MEWWGGGKVEIKMTLTPGLNNSVSLTEMEKPGRNRCCGRWGYGIKSSARIDWLSRHSRGDVAYAEGHVCAVLLRKVWKGVIHWE